MIVFSRRLIAGSAFPNTGSMQHIFRLDCNISKMATERDLNKGNPKDEYLDDSEAEDKKVKNTENISHLGCNIS